MTLSDIAAVARERDHLRSMLLWIALYNLAGRACGTELRSMIDALPVRDSLGYAA